MANSRTAIVVVNYGSSALLESNLVASASTTDLVVVVDNWTDDAERQRVRRLAREHGWLVEEPATNTGFGIGMNRGASRALRCGATSLVLLNPDARLAPEDVARLASQTEADADILLAPRIERPDGTPWMGTTMDLRLADGSVASSRRRPPGAQVMEWVSGAVMALSADLWRRSGGFDPDYFLYWEDVDLCRRVQAAGGRVAVDESVIAVHDEGGTHADGGGRAKSETYYYYNIRNRSLYAAKWLDPASRRRWALLTPRVAWGTILTGGRRQLVHSVRPWRAYARGLAASIPFALGRSRGRSRRTVRVLESFPVPSEQTNPYIVQLRDALRASPGVELTCWSWRDALTGRFDVFHTHWTEALIERRGWRSTTVRRALFGIFLARLWVTRTPVVRTVHNLELPDGLSNVERLYLRVVDRLTRVRIVLNEFTPEVANARNVLIEHGDYRAWFAPHERSEPVRGRIAFIGKVRRYKNVEGLVRAFKQVDDESFSLHVAGSPSSADLAESLLALSADDERVTLDLSFVEDARLVAEVTQAEIVALPYHEMHNSGSVLAVLSLARPVLVPDTPFNRALASEVGARWVHMFDGELSSRTLVDAVARVRRDAGGEPDLTRRDWNDAGRRHRNAFVLALRTGGGRA